MSKLPRSLRSSSLGCVLLTCILTLMGGSNAQAQTSLADTPVYSSSNVPANLMMALSVEYPTGTVGAYTNAKSYSASSTYLGYFNSAACYKYSLSSGLPGSTTSGYFIPVNTKGPTCSGYWSGNMLNWATMTALDEFRQALTGGNRIIDTGPASTPAGGTSTQYPTGYPTGAPANTTVLIRSNLNSQSSTGNFPNKQIDSTDNVSPSTVIGDTNYSSLSTVYLESAAQGTTFIISNNSSFSNSGSTGSGNNSVKNIATTYNAEVQVCVTGLEEANCNDQHTDYVGSNAYPKPEGLIQQNYTKIRVGASAYAFLSGKAQPNGVVRALLRDNGPTAYNGYGTRTNNTNEEWGSGSGVFVQDPDSSDSTYGTAPGGGAFTNSGAINYLNQFGYSNGYEQYDTVGDLYWATLAYYMQVPLDSTYTSGLTVTSGSTSGNSMDTAFPIFSGQPSSSTSSSSATVNDPIQYTCQSNAIVTIGDVHTWYDTRVPTSGGPTAATNQAALPVVTVTGLTSVDAGGYATKLGNLPLIEAQCTTAESKTMAGYLCLASGVGLGTTAEVSDTGQATYNLAGLAYYAHVNNIRVGAAGTTYGKITTYIVDVLEPGSYDGASGDEIYNPTKLGSGPGPSMYWLAAKYGGFNDINNNGIPANILTWHTNTSTAAALNLRPDNYFPGNQPTLIQSGLQQIFNNVASTASQSGAGAGVSATRALTNVTAGAGPFYSNYSGIPVYTTQYTPISWTGDVAGSISTDTAGGAFTTVTGIIPWHAQIQLDTLAQSVSGKTVIGWNTGRRVITWNGSKGVPFRYTNLSATEQTAISSAALVNYLRGDQSNEGTLYRTRTHILGDIVDSEAVLVQGASSPSYTESANPGYTTFSTSIQSRQPVVFAGANDGMLHAFEGDFLSATGGNPVTGGGSELYAYVPSLLYQGPNATPQVDGLAALANLNGVSTNNFSHHFYVDSTPQIADVDFTLIGSGTTAPSTTAGTSNWHTLLVDGLGKGGKGIFALDITNVPVAVDTTSSATVETSLAKNVLWEFTDSDMGYSYGRPLIVKTRKYGWVVVMTSGYNNPTGNGHLYILNAQTGALLEEMNTPTTVGTPTNPIGLTQATAYTQNVADGTIDQVYAGDLLGNVWRFDLSENAGTGLYPAPTLFATLTDSTGKAQPITTAPRIELGIDASGLGTLRWVFVGTGQFLTINDLTNTQQQTMYALRDGTGATPATTSLPLTRSVLVANTNLLTGLNLTDNSAGWYYDLTGTAGTNGGTERIVVNPDAAAGISDVAWTTLTPSTNPCDLLGNIYATSFSGQTQLVSGTTPIASQTTTSATTKIQIIQLPNGTYALMYNQTQSPPQTATINQGGGSKLPVRVNWREILN